VKCKHENADHIKIGEPVGFPGQSSPTAIVEEFRCLDCGGTLSLGPSNDDARGVQIEIRLADWLADREWPIDPRITRDDHDEALIEIASEQVPLERRGRSPIERMVDEACGIKS
jgi:hypothetical protein